MGNGEPGGDPRRDGLVLAMPGEHQGRLGRCGMGPALGCVSLQRMEICRPMAIWERVTGVGLPSLSEQGADGGGVFCFSLCTLLHSA